MHFESIQTALPTVTQDVLRDLLPNSMASFVNRWRDHTAPEGSGFKVFELDNWPAGRVHKNWCARLEAAGLMKDGTLVESAAALKLQCGSSPADAVFRHITRRLLNLGQLPGYRDEQQTVLTPEGVENCQVERALFKLFGLCSQAVHVHAQTADGLVWTARRALSKHENPGMYDNLAAGGLVAGESAELCALRECEEEAGLKPSDLNPNPSGYKGPAMFACWHAPTVAPQPLANKLETSLDTGRIDGAEGRPWLPIEVDRPLQDTWHHELIWPVCLHVSSRWTPHNQDGEVGGFELMSPTMCLQTVNRWQFTPDAGLVTALALTQTE